MTQYKDGLLDKKCLCCKTNNVNITELFCDNCWNYLEDELEPNDILLLMARCVHRYEKIGKVDEVKKMRTAMINWAYGKQDR